MNLTMFLSPFYRNSKEMRVWGHLSIKNTVNHDVRERSKFTGGGRLARFSKSRALKFSPPSNRACCNLAPPLSPCTEILPPLRPYKILVLKAAHRVLVRTLICVTMYMYFKIHELCD